MIGAALKKILRLGVEIDPKGSKRGADEVKQNLRSMSNEARRSTRQMGDQFDGLRSRIVQAFTFTAVIAGMRSVVKAAMEMETGLAQVGKTTGFVDVEIDKLRENIIGMGKDIPIATKGFLEVATAAGALGIKGVRDVTAFTKAVASLDAVTDIQGGEGGKQIARILSILDEDIGSIGEFADAINFLGSNAAATESEILSMTTELTKATGVFGTSSKEVLALSTAMVGLGQAPELAATGIGRIFRTINEGLIKGGEEADKLALIMGKSADEIKKGFADDAFGTVLEFLEEVEKSGENAGLVLASVGVQGDRLSRVLLPLVKNLDAVAAAEDVVARSAGSMQRELDRFAATTAGQFQLLDNRLNALKSSIGSNILPTLNASAQEASRIFDVFGEEVITAEQKFQIFALKILAGLEFIGDMIISTLTPIITGFVTNVGAAVLKVANTIELTFGRVFVDVAAGAENLINSIVQGLNKLPKVDLGTVDFDTTKVEQRIRELESPLNDFGALKDKVFNDLGFDDFQADADVVTRENTAKKLLEERLAIAEETVALRKEEIAAEDAKIDRMVEIGRKADEQRISDLMTEEEKNAAGKEMLGTLEDIEEAHGGAAKKSKETAENMRSMRDWVMRSSKGWKGAT